MQKEQQPSGAELMQLPLAGNSFYPQKVTMQASSRTLPTASLHSNCTFHDDDDFSMSGSSMFGEFVPVDSDVNLGEAMGDLFPTSDKNPAATTAHIMSLAIDALKAKDDFSDVPYGMEVTCHSEDHDFIPEAHQGSQVQEDVSFVSERTLGLSTHSVRRQETEERHGIEAIGHASMRSLEEAFHDLSACMERTAESRELVKQFQQQLEPSLPSTAASETRKVSLDVSCHGRQSPHFTKSLAAPTKTRSILSKDRSFRERKDTRDRKNFARSTGVRPVNWDLLL